MAEYCPDCARTLVENDDGEDECPTCEVVVKEWF